MISDHVKSIIQQYSIQLESQLPTTVKAIYLYGSIALDAYIEGSSDIDFIVIVNNELTDRDIKLLAEVHSALEALFPKLDIMGAYIREKDLGKRFGEIPQLINYYNKVLDPEGRGADINPITWWILKSRGIYVYGENIDFNYDLHLESLVDYVKWNMNIYWVGWIDRLSEKATIRIDQNSKLELDGAVEWCALGMLRQLYTIQEHDVTSKIGAGEYGLKKLPERWHGLIQEAISIKAGKPISAYESQEVRLHDLVELLQFIQRECNR